MKTTRRMFHPAPKRPNLDALLEKAKSIPFTKEMRAAQQESWVSVFTGWLLVSMFGMIHFTIKFW